MEHPPIETFTPTFYPSWLKPPPLKLGSAAPPLPAWLTSTVPVVKPTKEGKALLLVQYELAFPVILERICEGDDLTVAIEEYPVPLNRGAFTTWMYKDREREAMYNEAKKVRAEVWTGLMVKHALGEKTTDTLDRSKTIIETLKWLISRHSRKEYGDTKAEGMNVTINIKAALERAQERVIDVKHSRYDDDEVTMTIPRMISSGDEDNEDDE